MKQLTFHVLLTKYTTLQQLSLSLHLTHTLLFDIVLHTTGSEKNSWLEINFISLHHTIHEDQHKILSF